MRRDLLAIGLMVMALAPQPVAQQRDRTDKPVEKRVGTAVVAGKVTVSETSDVPVRRAIVTLAATDGVESLSAVTDNEGRFAFSAVADGRYTLSARKAAHLTSSYGAKRPGRPGTTMILAEGQQLTGLRLILPPGGVITGVVRMPTGDPLTNTQVVAIPTAQLAAGGQTVNQQAFRTDDRGEFRIYGLAPGTYLVGALPSVGRGEIHQRSPAEFDQLTRTLAQRTPPPSQPAGAPPAPPPPPMPLVGFAPSYYPGTPIAANASMVTVRAGEVRDGIDILVSLVRVGTISGVVRTPDGRPTQNVQLSVIASGPPLPLSGAQSVRTNRPDKDGRFTLTNVAPGSYRITARAGGVTYSDDGTSVNIRGDQQTQWAVADVQVQGEDVEGVLLQLHHGLTFTGRMVATGNAPPPDTWKGASIRIQEPRSGGTPGVVMNGVAISGGAQRTANMIDDGTFEIIGVQPATYDIEVILPTALRSVWSVKSIMAGGRDVRDAPLTFDQGSVSGVVITLTDQPTELAGTLSSTSGQAATDYYVVVFPADRALWHERSPRIRVLRPAADGGFNVRGLPPGAYRIAALTDVEENEWRTAAFLDSVLDASIAVTVADGQITRQDIRIR